MLDLTRIAVLLCLLPCLAAPHAWAQPAGDVEAAGVEILVYKKWIGGGDEADVEAHLVCDGGPARESRRINRDKPDGWLVEDVPSEGYYCTVYEVERETFIADIEDCRDLLILPGQGAECTLVNTKVVKRIEMLNRYGLVMMIAVMLGAGLAAVHRYQRA